jgi:hypothetical protein
MLEVVIGDVHARADLLRAVLGCAGVLDSRGRRREDAWVVQVGDLLDRRASLDDNLAAASLAADTIDVVLAGNHEARMLGSGAHGPALALLATRGWPHAAAASGGWLITHAGVHPGLGAGLPADVSECVAEINDRWWRERGDPLFDWIGPARDGDAPHGGLLWLGAGEWPRDLGSPGTRSRGTSRSASRGCWRRGGGRSTSAGGIGWRRWCGVTGARGGRSWPRRTRAPALRPSGLGEGGRDSSRREQRRPRTAPGVVDVTRPLGRQRHTPPGARATRPHGAASGHPGPQLAPRRARERVGDRVARLGGAGALLAGQQARLPRVLG